MYVSHHSELVSYYSASGLHLPLYDICFRFFLLQTEMQIFKVRCIYWCARWLLWDCAKVQKVLSFNFSLLLPVTYRFAYFLDTPSTSTHYFSVVSMLAYTYYHTHVLLIASLA